MLVSLKSLLKEFTIGTLQYFLCDGMSQFLQEKYGWDDGGPGWAHKVTW